MWVYVPDEPTARQASGVFCPLGSDGIDDVDQAMDLFEDFVTDVTPNPTGPMVCEIDAIFLAHPVLWTG